MSFETQRYRRKRQQKIVQSSKFGRFFRIRQWRYVAPAAAGAWLLVISLGAIVGYDLFAGTPREITINNVARVLGVLAFAGAIAVVREEKWVRVIVIVAGVPILWLAQRPVAAWIVCRVFGDCG